MKPGLHVRQPDREKTAAPERDGEASAFPDGLPAMMAMDGPDVEPAARLYSAGLPVAGFLMAMAAIAILTDASYLVSLPLVAGALTLAGLSLFVPRRATRMG